MLLCLLCCVLFFLFKQKTAYEMRISDWSSDVCSSDLQVPDHPPARAGCVDRRRARDRPDRPGLGAAASVGRRPVLRPREQPVLRRSALGRDRPAPERPVAPECAPTKGRGRGAGRTGSCPDRSEEHTSELPSIMRTSPTVYSLKKKK